MGDNDDDPRCTFHGLVSQRPCARPATDCRNRWPYHHADTWLIWTEGCRCEVDAGGDRLYACMSVSLHPYSTLINGHPNPKAYPLPPCLCTLHTDRQPPTSRTLPTRLGNGNGWIHMPQCRPLTPADKVDSLRQLYNLRG